MATTMLLLRLLKKNPRSTLPIARHFSSHSPPSSPPPPLPSSPHQHRRFPILFSGTLISTLVLSPLLLPTSPEPDPSRRSRLDDLVDHSRDSLDRVLGSMRRTGAAAAVLWRSLASVLSSANHEVQRGFELRVASLVADIAAANEGRRAAIVSAGRGMVVDWLLETVAGGKDGECLGTQAESARALAYLLSDPNVCEAVLGRPHAVPNLLRFIFSFQPKRAKKHKHSSFDGTNNFKGGSMLVAAIMDIVTSNCDHFDRTSFRPSLPANATMGDISAALQVIEEGGMHFHEKHSCDDEDDGDTGMRGIGIKVLGGTTVLGFSKTDDLLLLEKFESNSPEYVSEIPGSVLWQKSCMVPFRADRSTSASVPGLWDDLQREHVAVPFAAWALANWALASEFNRSHILDLDRDGLAIMSALTAPERTVKWHGSLVAHVLLEDQNLPLTDSVPDWSFSLLSTVSQASSSNDITLVQAALSAFLLSLKRSDESKTIIMKKGLHLMREAAKGTQNYRQIQENLARALELLCTSNMSLSVEESQKWAAILLRWVFNKNKASNMTRSSAKKILSCIFEVHGPSSIPISQGWLAMLLSEVLGESKIAGTKGSTPAKTNQVKTQIDQSNVVSASQVTSQLANAVVSLAGNQAQRESESSGVSPLADFLSLEPFAASFKNFNKDKLRKFDAADSALSTVKGVKALTELCSEDSACQKKIVEYGVFGLLRRFLLGDDYEKLAAIETHDGLHVSESPEQRTVPGSTNDANDPSSVQVPPPAHIRRHAARLLMNLSVHLDVKNAILSDKMLCKWLDDCASEGFPCCNDLKLQSYARTTLLNAYCFGHMDTNLQDDDHQKVEPTTGTNKCPLYSDMLFLINPELPHWKSSDRDGNSTQQDSVGDSGSAASHGLLSSHDHGFTGREYSTVDSIDMSCEHSEPAAPTMDVVFVHGLRGGPFKSWRIAENKSSTKSKAGLVENIDQEAGKQGTCWPREWLSYDFPQARLFTVKYKTNLSQWTGASLPLQEVSLLLLQKLLSAGIGDRPVVFVTHSMGGLVVKQMLYEAKAQNFQKFVDNTIGVVFYSCPHFGSKLADMPWSMGLVLRPAPTIGELRSGSPRLLELNEFLRFRYNKGLLDILSFSEVTPIVEGYGGWAFRMEIVPMESAYPGFGNLIVLDATDHINSCKPVNRTDPSYAKTLDFLEKLKANLT